MAKKYILAASQIFGHPGGIQTFMRLIARSLCDEGKLESIVSLCDDPGDFQASQWQREFNLKFCGCRHSKFKFFTKLFRLGRFDSPILFGHIAQAPVGWFLKKIRRISDYAIVLHGVEAWRKLPPAELAAANGAARLICTTPFTAEQLLRHNPSINTPIRIVPLALEPDRFLPFAKHFSSSNELQLLSVGRLVASESGKGVDHTIRSFGRLGELKERLVYTVIGDGDDLPRLKKLALEFNVAERVIFKGVLPDSELRKAFENADVFIMPSQQEGFGLAYLEAMHYSLPVIASREGGVPYVIENAKTGLLTEYGNDQSIAEAIRQMFDPEIRICLGRKAKSSVMEKFSFQAFKKNISAAVDF